MTRLEGSLIRLRPMTLEDATERYLAWTQDPETMKFLETQPNSYTVTQLREYVKKVLEDPRNHFFAIEDHAGGAHIGNIKLGPVDENNRVGDIGLLIGDKDFWGRGVATESIQLLVQHAFTDLKLHKVTAGAYIEHIASIKAFRKVGFIIEGIRHSHYQRNNNYKDAVLMAYWNSCIKNI